MSLLGAFCDFLGVLAGLAAFGIVAVFFLVTLTRKSSLAWINVHFSLVAVAIGCECLSNVQALHRTLPAPELWSRALLYVSVMLCAVLSVPLYQRVKRNPKFDEIQSANRELEYSKRLFKTFLDETPFAAYVVASKDRFVYVNSHTARDHNVTADEMVQTTYDKWFPPEITERLVGQNAAVLASGQRQEFVNDIVLASGKATYLSYKFPLPGPGDDPLLGVVSLEISEELKAKAIDSLLARIVELSPEAMYTVDEDLRITSWNNAAEKIFGYTAAEIIGQPVTILAPPDSVQDVAGVISRLGMGEIIKNQKFIHVAKDGKKKHLLLSATKIKSFPKAGESYAAIARDQTEARQTARKMRALNRALDARVAALSQANRDLPIARDQALEALELRSTFAASMSHAIRTPLSGILGLSELLLDNHLDQDSSDALQTIHDSSLELVAIVNDILDLSKLQDDTVGLEEKPFSPTALIQDCIKLLQPGAASKQIKIHTRLDPCLPEQLIGDQSRIRQIVLNLLGNAIKFTAKGSVTIEAGLLSNDASTTATIATTAAIATATTTASTVSLQISVTDTGIGIAADHAPLLFTPFSRIKSSTKGIKGSGLGLAISKRFVHLMKGQIDFESRPGGGSKFWFVIPLKIMGDS